MYLILEGEFRVTVHILLRAHAYGCATPGYSSVLSQGQLSFFTGHCCTDLSTKLYTVTANEGLFR